MTDAPGDDPPSRDDADDDRRRYRRVDFSTAVTLRKSGSDDAEPFDEVVFGDGSSDFDDLDAFDGGLGGHGLDESAETMVDGSSADVSLGGMYVRSAEKLPEGDSVEVEFSLETRDVEFDIEGTVRWNKPDGKREGRQIWGMGIEFVDLTERQRDLLEEFVEEQTGDGA